MLQKVMPPRRNPAWLSLPKKRRMWRMTVCCGKVPQKPANAVSSCHFANACSNCCKAYWSSASGRNNDCTKSRQRSVHSSAAAGLRHSAARRDSVRIKAAKRPNTSRRLTSPCHALTFCQSGLPSSGSIQPNTMRSNACCQVNRLSAAPRIVPSKPQCTFNSATVSCSSGKSSAVSPKRRSTKPLSNSGSTLSTSNRLSSKSSVCSSA